MNLFSAETLHNAWLRIEAKLLLFNFFMPSLSLLGRKIIIKETRCFEVENKSLRQKENQGLRLLFNDLLGAFFICRREY